MKRSLWFVQAFLMMVVLMVASNASADLTHYFDAQILDFNSGKTVVPKNTTLANGTPFSATPNPDPGGAGDNGSNWTQNIGQPARGQDGLWNQRFASPAPGNFGNADPDGNGTIYESRGNSGGPNPENLPTLKTTVSVPQAVQGQNKSVWVMFWSDGSPWQVSASLTNMDDDTAPQYIGGSSQSPAGYVLEAFDAGQVLPDMIDTNGNPDLAAGYPINAANTILFTTAANYTSTDAGAAAGSTGRHLWAGFLGDVVLGTSLDVFVGDGRPLNATQLANNGGANHRTWYDGIAFGDPTGLPRLPDLPPVPEPTAIALAGLALIGCGGLIRRRTR